MPDVPVDRKILAGLAFRVPPDPIKADLGDGSAHTVHLLPSQVDCQEVVFVAKGHPMDHEGYAIPLSELRADDPGGHGWVSQLAQKLQHGDSPAWAMLAQALASKAR